MKNLALIVFFTSIACIQETIGHGYMYHPSPWHNTNDCSADESPFDCKWNLQIPLPTCSKFNFGPKSDVRKCSILVLLLCDQTSLGTNSLMFMNCSVICDVRHVQSSILGQNVMFGKFDVRTFNVWCVRSSVFWCSFQDYYLHMTRDQFSECCFVMWVCTQALFSKLFAQVQKIPYNPRRKSYQEIMVIFIHFLSSFFLGITYLVWV